MLPRPSMVRLCLLSLALAASGGSGLILVGRFPIEEPHQISRMVGLFLTGSVLGVLTSLPLVLRLRRDRRRAWNVRGLLAWVPRSIRDDAEGLIREFADVRDRDRAAGGVPWRTSLKCGCFLALFLLRTAIGAAVSAVVGRLLRL